MDKSVAVIVVTPEADDDLDGCLASLSRQSHPAAEVAVVINGGRSSLSRLDKWKTKLPLSVTVNSRNKGFANPHKDALPSIKSEWVAVLNADARAESDWLERMLSAVEGMGADVGMAACAVLMAHDPERLESLGLEPSRSGMAYLRRWGEPYREEATHEVFGASGCAAMYKREMLDETGFFDSDLFAYYEDLDMAWRARWKGWRCVAAPRARVHHKGSSYNVNTRKTYFLHRNRLLVIASDWPAGLILKNISRIILWDLMAFGRAVISQKSASPIMAKMGFLARLPRAILKRRKRLKGRAPGAEAWLVDDMPRAKARGYL